MPNRVKDLTGKQFGELTVLYRNPENAANGKALWVCKCSCGNTTIVRGDVLNRGDTKSCGLCKRTLTPLYVRTHKNRLYHAWSEMRRRCNGQCTNHQYYGDKGISYCAEWDDFDTFAKWAIENGYQKGLEIDRIDGDKDYCPENCRWITHKANSRNRKARKNNNTGVAGVTARKRTDGKMVYRAIIKTDDGRIPLGTYDTLEEAAAVRHDAELKYWGFAIGE